MYHTEMNEAGRRAMRRACAGTVTVVSMFTSEDLLPVVATLGML